MSNETPGPEPSIDLETTLAVHSLLDELLGEDIRYPKVWEGNKLTELKHGKVFPKIVCEGKLSAVFVDPTISQIYFNCELQCEDVQKRIWANGSPAPDRITKNWEMYFREVGYLSPDHIINEDGSMSFNIKGDIHNPEGHQHGEID